MNNVSLFENEYKLNEEQKQKFTKYYKLINEYNQVMNLTGIDDKEGVYLKHFYDSLLIAKEIPAQNQTIADIGSGAGFPGIVLAIFFPNNKFELVEPMTKRCKFLETVVSELRLDNVKIINLRAEEIKDKKYDIITTRAVARLNILLELIIPLLKPKGIFIALKGKNYEQEIIDSLEALKILNCEILKTNIEILPVEKSERGNIVIQKTKSTNKIYPRNYGQIKKKPL